MQRDPLRFLTRVAREHGDISHFMFGPLHAYLFNHPDLIRDVLVTHGRSFMKGRALQRTKILLGEGLLTSEGEFHLRQRRLAQPAFHRDRIAKYAEAMIELAAATRDEWRDGDERDIAYEMMRLTLGIVARTLFGVDVAGETDEIAAALTELMETFTVAISPWAELLRKLPLPRVRRLERAIARLDATVYRIIEQRRASGEDRGDLLSMLLLARDVEADGGGMSDNQVRDEVMTLFLAGHETTANALAWTWLMLSRNPDTERAMHDEIDRVVGTRAPQPADVARLPYVEMVLAESMRLYPPAWVIGRICISDVEIGGWTIRKGSIGIVSQWVMHRDARYWPDPERFDPLRFTAEAKAARPKFAYFPFGGGTRICIGEGFAWTEGVLLLATLAQRWRVRVLDHDVEPLPRITLRPKGGIRARLSPRA
jgi:cytochrome P450